MKKPNIHYICQVCVIVTTPLVTSKRPIVTCFTTQSLKIKFTITTKMSCTPFDIHKSNLQGANKQLANVGYTYKLMVFCTKLSKIVSTKTFLNWRTICGHSLYDTLWSQTNSTILINKRHFTTSNMRSSKKPSCVGSSFLNLPKDFKWKVMWPFLIGISINGSFCLYLPTNNPQMGC